MYSCRGGPKCVRASAVGTARYRYRDTQYLEDMTGEGR